MGRPRGGHKDITRLLRLIEAAGARAVLCRSGHWKIYVGQRYVTTMSNSPSDTNACHRVLRDLRRYGGLDV